MLLIQHTSLHLAALNNKPEVIDVLVEAGADIEERGEDDFTPVHLAANERIREALLCIVEHGANVDAQTNTLKTPLMAAAPSAGAKGAAEVADYLLRAGSDETIVDDRGRKAVDVIGQHVAVQRRSAGDIERVRRLLTNAPADRAWRRRGYLVLCRVHPDRVRHHNQASSDTRRSDTAWRTRSPARLAMAGGGSAGDSAVREGAGVDWAVMA